MLILLIERDICNLGRVEISHIFQKNVRTKISSGHGYEGGYYSNTIFAGIFSLPAVNAAAKAIIDIQILLNRNWL